MRETEGSVCVCERETHTEGSVRDTEGSVRQRRVCVCGKERAWANVLYERERGRMTMKMTDSLLSMNKQRF